MRSSLPQRWVGRRRRYRQELTCPTFAMLLLIVAVPALIGNLGLLGEFVSALAAHTAA